MVNAEDVRQKSRVGNVLLKKGWLKSEQLEQALTYQRKAGIRLGDALIQLGYIDRKQLQKALVQQNWSRSSIAGVMLAASQLFITACGGGGGDEKVTQVTIDPGTTQTNSAPSLTITSPNGGSSYNEGDTVSFTANADDNEDGNISDNIQWSSDQDGSLGSGASVSAMLSTGSHVITAIVEDSEGEQTSKTISISVNTATDQAPTLAISSPTTGSSFSEGSNIQFTANADDAEDGDLTGEIEWSSSINGVLGNGGSISAALSIGNHVITATVTDSNGTEVAELISISVSAVADNAPNVSISAPVGGSVFQPSDDITFIAEAIDDEDGDISGEIIWYSDIAGEIGRGAEITTPLSTADHQITAEVTDSGGNTQQTQVDITVAAVDGLATISWTAPTQNTDESDLNDLAGFKIYYGEDENNLTQSIMIADPGQLFHVFEDLTSGKTFYFVVTAVNSFGVESDPSEVVSKQT